VSQAPFFGRSWRKPWLRRVMPTINTYHMHVTIKPQLYELHWNRFEAFFKVSVISKKKKNWQKSHIGKSPVGFRLQEEKSDDSNFFLWWQEIRIRPFGNQGVSCFSSTQLNPIYPSIVFCLTLRGEGRKILSSHSSPQQDMIYHHHLPLRVKKKL